LGATFIAADPHVMDIPVGYRRTGKELTLDFNEAKVVREIFRVADGGSSGAQIAESLNVAEFKRRNGSPWMSVSNTRRWKRFEIRKEGASPNIGLRKATRI